MVVGKAIANRIKSGEVVGVGTGSTVDAALECIRERVVREGLALKVLASSLASARTCSEMGLEVLDPSYAGSVAWGFDGADEVTPDLRLIKGKGAAMLPEKILAARCAHWVVIVDETKLVTRLGEKQPVPVEVVPAARVVVERALKEMGASQCLLRTGSGKHGPVITEAGNLIFDVRFPEIGADYEMRLKSITGVVETGIFSSQADEVLVASAQGLKTLHRN